MSGSNGWVRRHPVLTLLGFNLALFLLVALIAEIALRLYVPYNPGFYVSVEGSSREVVYPYGTIKINSHGFPDDEFDLSRDFKVGYFGDSVTYGVGAGHGYRFSDLLVDAYPDFEHMNFAGIGLSVTESTIGRIDTLAREFDLDVLIYFFNLNDIVPDRVASRTERIAIADVRRSLLEYVDWLRGRSYLYTSLRTAAKNFLEARGVGFHGYSAYELYPERERVALRETAGRINELGRTLRDQGVELIVVLLPYEMQVSQEAAETYLGHGIQWEDGFIEGRTQEIMLENLDPGLRTIDLLPAFIDLEDAHRSRRQIGVGEYFVYNKGDKLDWNHPNRTGHRAIADYLASVDLLAAPEQLAALDVE